MSIEVLIPPPVLVTVSEGIPGPPGPPAAWGTIPGDIQEQEDLIGLLASKVAEVDLQRAYDNSAAPKVITDLTKGAVKLQRGTPLDTDTILEFLDGAGNIRASVSGDGTAVFGNKAAGNYSGFEPDGTYKMTGDATVFDDISLSGLSFSPGGAASPDIIDFVNPNLKVFGFDGGSTIERLYITTEMRHEYKEGSDLELHVHWAPTTTGAGNVKWQLYYSWVSVDGVYSSPVLLPVISPARGTAWQNTYASFGIIPGAGQGINSQLILQLFRDPGDGEDTYGADAALIALGIHYEKDTVGSRQRTAK